MIVDAPVTQVTNDHLADWLRALAAYRTLIGDESDTNRKGLQPTVMAITAEMRRRLELPKGSTP